MKKPTKLKKLKDDLHSAHTEIGRLIREHATEVDGLNTRHRERIKETQRGILVNELTVITAQAKAAKRLAQVLEEHERILKDNLKTIGVEL